MCIATWLCFSGSLLIGFWLWLQELAEEGVRVVGSFCKPEVLHLPLHLQALPWLQHLPF